MLDNGPPARYSVTQADFDPEIGRRLLIRLDGVEQHMVVEYDCEEGWVLRNKPDENGKAQLAPNKREVWKETVTGHVTAEWRD